MKTPDTQNGVLRIRKCLLGAILRRDFTSHRSQRTARALLVRATIRRTASQVVRAALCPRPRKRIFASGARKNKNKSQKSHQPMEGIAISPSAGEFGVLDLLFYYFRVVSQSDELPFHY